MKHPTFLLPGLISMLLLIILAVAFYVDHQQSPVVPRTPIPAATLASFQPGGPINNPTQAFVAAQFYLATTRLRATGDILPYSAELIPFPEAIARTGIPTDITPYRAPLSDTEVWLVLFAGIWFVEPPIPDPTTTEGNTAGAQCVYAILNAGNGMGMSAGGIRDCAAYTIRPAGQIIQDLMRAKGLIALPGSQAYEQLMQGILLGDYPELTGPQATLVHNQAELGAVVEYAAQHLQDGNWNLWPQTIEPDIPEALPPTETPRPTQVPPPQPIWFNPVITVPLSIPAGGKIQTGVWLSATRLQVTTDAYQSSGFYWIDLGTGEPFITTPRPAPASEQDYSASSLYSIQCGNPLQMMDAANQTVISQADLILNPNAVTSCSTFVGWSGDEIAAFAARDEGVWSTYLWLPDGSPPTRVGPALNGARPPAWSPDGGQFAFLAATDAQPFRLQIMIADRSGSISRTLPTNLVLQPTEFRWLGQQVLALRNSNNLWQYYQVETGEVLFTWQEALSMGSTWDHQYPEISPDGRWFPIERSGAPKSYHLFDLQNRREITLYDRPWHMFEFNGWSPAGDCLYLLHLPGGPDAEADLALPYGLLAYYPSDGQFELLVENARAVHWDANHQKALVLAFVQDISGLLTLTAGIWDRATNQVAGAVPFISPPTQYDPLLHPHSLNSIVPAAWAPDGRQVALFTWQGDLLLMKPDGQTQLIASQIGLGRSDFTRLLAWSPDGLYLFVSDRGTAWVVSLTSLDGVH